MAADLQPFRRCISHRLRSGRIADFDDDVVDSATARLFPVYSGNLVLCAIKSAVLNRFRYMGTGYALRTRNIGYRTCKLENAMIRACRQS